MYSSNYNGFEIQEFFMEHCIWKATFMVFVNNLYWEYYY